MQAYIVPVALLDIHRVLALQHAAAVNEDRHVPELERAREYLLGIGHVAQISRDEVSLAPRRSDRVASSGVAQVALGDNDAGAGLGEREGNSGANAWMLVCG